jgi:predicted metal-dependent hydrolase
MILPPFVSIESRKVKHARLRVSESGQVRFIVPQGLTQKQVGDLYARKASWVEEQLVYFSERASHSVNLVPSPHSILLHGEPYSFFYRAGVKTRVNHTSKIIESALLLNDSATVQKWYRRYAKIVLNDLVRQLALEHGIPFSGRVYVRDSSTKWGNCSRQGNISLNWRLVLVPPSAGYYVALHELVHTQIPNHSQSFWLRMKRKMPNYREATKVLDEYVQELKER